LEINKDDSGIMFKPIKLIDIELSRPLVTIEGLYGYELLQALVRLHNTPIGFIKVPVINGRCTPTDLRRAIQKQKTIDNAHHFFSDDLSASAITENLRINDLLKVPPPVYPGPQPLVTVAVCTRDRTEDLRQCLDSLNDLDYPALDILVIDNAPRNDDTEQLARTTFPGIRYVLEPRPGLDWARNRAITEARGEIIAYTDDDVVVDPGWVKALVETFNQNDSVMAVTGLVVPYELETEAQILFERHGGFGRGFVYKEYRAKKKNGKVKALHHSSVGRFGTGANMAFRSSLFHKIGYFDPALDVGTVTNGGGDLEMFFRVLKEGYTLCYEPRALVRHKHRRNYHQLREQLTNWGTGFISYFMRSALAYPDERFAFFRVWLWWLMRKIRLLLISFTGSSRFSPDLLLAEICGSFLLGRYPKARRTAAKIAQIFGSATQVVSPKEACVTKDDSRT
jgi:GT2 family glycosyltransferase